MFCNRCRAAADWQFDRRVAQRDLQRYRRRGPVATTRTLLAALGTRVRPGSTLLDIGGGVGVIVHELLQRGIASATHVEAAAAYHQLARDEAERRGLAPRAAFVLGDFVELSGSLPPADIVTLDRVVCCYPDFRELLERSAPKARRFYALSFPRERWAVRAVIAVQNRWRRLVGNPFRTFVHPVDAMTRLIRVAGFREWVRERTLVWEIVVYERDGAPPPAGAGES